MKTTGNTIFISGGSAGIGLSTARANNQFEVPAGETPKIHALIEAISNKVKT